MKKTLIATAILAMGGVTTAFAASDVTLYGIIEQGVVVSKAKHHSTTAELKSGFDQGSRWGIKGTEDLGNGYSVGFILEQGFNADDGAEGTADYAFNRESVLNVKGGFGSLAFGKTGALSSGAQSQHILTGWALGTGFGITAWNAQTGGTLRPNNTVSYASPKFAGFSAHAMYSNGTGKDDQKWSKNAHYYGLGVKYNANAVNSSLIFEYLDTKDKVKADQKEVYIVNYGLEYNLGDWTPMFAYQFYHQDKGVQVHKFGLSANVKLAGGEAKLGAAYLFGKDDGVAKGKEDDIRNWNIGAAYIYPLSKRTAVKAYAGYSDSSKSWKDRDTDSNGKVVANYNGYAVYLGLRHSF